MRLLVVGFVAHCGVRKDHYRNSNSIFGAPKSQGIPCPALGKRREPEITNRCCSVAASPTDNIGFVWLPVPALCFSTCVQSSPCRGG